MSNWPSSGFVWFSQQQRNRQKQRKNRLSNAHEIRKYCFSETSKLLIRGQYFHSVSYVLLHFLTFRLFEKISPLFHSWGGACAWFTCCRSNATCSCRCLFCCCNWALNASSSSLLCRTLHICSSNL